MLEKQKLEEYIKTKSEDKISHTILDEFINLIFDETEENRNQMPKENFMKKYHLLLKLLKEESSQDEIDLGNSSWKKNQLKKEKSLKNHSIIGRSKEIDHSEILIEKEKSLDNNHIDNSLDANELFREINFNDSSILHSDSLKSETHRPSSVVRPTNTFNFTGEQFKLNFEDKPKINLKNQPRNLVNLCKLNTIFQNDTIYENNNQNTNNLKTSNASPQYINFQHNININVNNYGNLNMNPITGSINFSRNGINQKLQEVFHEINKTNEKPIHKKMLSRKPTINIEDIMQNKKETIIPSNLNNLNNINPNPIKKDGYLLDFCRSVNINNRTNTNLNRISERLINKRESGSIYNSNSLLNSQFLNKGVNKGINSNITPCKEKYINYKFFTLEKLLQNSDAVYTPPLQANACRSSSATANNFESLEEQLQNLCKRNYSLKDKNNKNIEKMNEFNQEDINEVSVLQTLSDRAEDEVKNLSETKV
jgi:hypothetical protein